ncbi:hypothetical protein BZA70DRAFT_273873 [Myxozyma melibiosi]|uniref:F-box domain-containing protein n=1 Tax=Myxozyma melibiosi TaxID=54550 RepID=A0ABR1FF48_9ASCO
MAVASFPLIELPQEIIVDVFAVLELGGSKDDLRNLAYTCKRLYSIGQQFLVSDITVTWQLLDAFRAKLDTSLAPVRSYITSFTINIPSSWGEWHRFETLQDVFELCTNINSLTLTLSGSSKWMQYMRPNTHIRSLKLVSSQASGLPALFDTADLHAFKSVEELHLEYFRLQCEYPIEERATPLLTTVRNLEIVNCEWNYPFSMSLFKRLDSLAVYYSIKCEAFTFSERLKNLAANPPPTIKRFIMHLNLFSPVRQKTWYPVLKDCKKLESISMKGFRYPDYEFFALLPPSLKEVELHMTSKNLVALTHSNSLDTGMGGMLAMNSQIVPVDARAEENDGIQGRVLNKYGDTNVRVVAHEWAESMEQRIAR